MGNQDKPTDLIMDAFKEKTWNEIHTTDSWRVFKIISELVEGFEKLARIGPCVSIFGSARTHHNDKYYRLAEDIAEKRQEIKKLKRELRQAESEQAERDEVTK